VFEVQLRLLFSQTQQQRELELWVTLTHVDGRIVRNIGAHREIDILRRRWQVLAKGCIPFHDLDHIRGTDPTLDQDLRRSIGTGRENDSSVRRQRNNAIRPQASVVRADPGDFGTIANDAVNRSPHLQLEITPGPRSAEVRSNRPCTLPALELD